MLILNSQESGVRRPGEPSTVSAPGDSHSMYCITRRLTVLGSPGSRPFLLSPDS